jgi:hypothetical protein
VEEPVVVEEPVADEDPRADGLAAPIAVADRLAPAEPPVPGLGPGATVSTKAVTSEPIALQSRLLSVPEKRTSWFAPAIRRLAAQRDAKLAAELVIELLPAQRGIVDGPLNYEIKIGELGTFYVTLDPGQATISREPRGSVDFSLEGPVAAFSELAAGGASRRHPGLLIRRGKRRARRFLKTRRRPIALADLAAAGVDVWPGLLLLAMAEAPEGVALDELAREAGATPEQIDLDLKRLESRSTIERASSPDTWQLQVPLVAAWVARQKA